jgi:hypothetical protein
MTVGPALVPDSLAFAARRIGLVRGDRDRSRSAGLMRGRREL